MPNLVLEDLQHSWRHGGGGNISRSKFTIETPFLYSIEYTLGTPDDMGAYLAKRMYIRRKHVSEGE